jgi:hypothetical protein
MPHHQTTTLPTLWSLEVVRGRDVGRVFSLSATETVLGNGLNGEPGLDMRDQEETSPRRMAARQAAIVVLGPELAIRDLDSPGGTFVNQQRLLSGQSRRLQPGDVIQLAGIMLRVVSRHAPPTNAPAAPSTRPPVPPPLPTSSAKPSAQATTAAPLAATVPGRLPAPFVMAGGSSCRTWDDFLVLAAQRWKELRDELGSGRLNDYLHQIQRTDLIPRTEKNRSLDEQLDQWLARLPVIRASDPELDVHPDSLNLRPVAGGGIIRQVLRITNVGYRLLRCSARVEPDGTSWIRLHPEQDGRPFDTIEQTDLPIDLVIPEVLDRPLAATIVLDSNGGTRRVTVRIERPTAPPSLPEPVARPDASPLPTWGRALLQRMAHLRPGVRFAAGIFGAVGLRTLVMLASLLPVGGRGTSITEPRLPAMAVAFAIVGGMLGGLLTRRAGEGDRRDFVASAFAGGWFGLLTAAVIYALIRSVELLLGGWLSSVWAIELVWAMIGAGLAALSGFFIPHRSDPSEAAP